MSAYRVVCLKIDAVPVAQPRQRHRVIQSGGRPIAANYTPGSHPVNAYKAAIKVAATAHGDGLFEGPLRVEMDFVFPRPKSKIWKTKAMPRERHTAKPDADNLFKSTADALNRVLWRDDSQIAETLIKKWIASGDETAHVEIKITELA